MALTKAALSAKLVTYLTAAAAPIVDATKLKAFCDAMAQAIVEEIQSDAIVTGTVTSGAGAGGTIQGTVS